MARKRTVLIIFASVFDGHFTREFATTIPADGPISKLFHFLKQAVDSPDFRDDHELTTSLGEPAEYHLFDWSGVSLPSDIRVEAVPKPGIIVAVRTDSRTVPAIAATAVRIAYERTPELREFLGGWYAQVEPASHTGLDVFVSYSTKDTDLAVELTEALSAKGVACFVAPKEINAGQPWIEEIRSALIRARLAIILLTPNSIESRWVMSEAGACWALGKPLIPAVM